MKSDIVGTSEQFLSLAYQDDKGYWHKADKTIVDTVNNSIKVSTKHFSDWTKYARSVITKDKTTSLKENEETNLVVKIRGNLQKFGARRN